MNKKQGTKVTQVVNSAPTTAAVQRRTRQLRGLNPHQQATVEELTRRLVESLLHHPITRCTQLAAGPDGHRYVDLLHALYGP